MQRIDIAALNATIRILKFGRDLRRAARSEKGRAWVSLASLFIVIPCVFWVAT